MDKEKTKLQIINDVLKGLLDLQLIYFDDNSKFDVITDIILKYQWFISDEIKKES